MLDKASCLQPDCMSPMCSFIKVLEVRCWHCRPVGQADRLQAGSGANGTGAAAGRRCHWEGVSFQGAQSAVAGAPCCLTSLHSLMSNVFSVALRPVQTFLILSCKVGCLELDM